MAEQFPNSPRTPRPAGRSLALAATIILGVIVFIIGGGLLLARLGPQPEAGDVLTRTMLDPSEQTGEHPDDVVVTGPVIPVAPLTVTPLDFAVPEQASNLYLQFILDASGSMMARLPDGTLRRDAAREVLIAHLRAFPPQAHIGLRAFGHRMPWRGQEDASCRDIEQVAPVETGQLERMALWLRDFEAQGMTPLAEAIRQAMDDFVNDPARVNTLIMISDGEETCGGDPCPLVEALKAQGINFTLHVVGLDVAWDARAQLQCIAEAGGGLYRDADSAATLDRALGEIGQATVGKPPESPTTVAIAPPAITPEPTPTPLSLPVLPGTPVPLSEAAITPENVTKVVQLARWGKGQVTQVAYSPDNSILALASTLGVYLYDADTLDELRLLETTSWARHIAFSPDGSLLAVGTWDGLVQLWQLSDGALLHTMKGHENSVNSMAFSPDGSTFASAGDMIVQLWQVSDGALLRTLEGHSERVMSVTFSPDGSIIASGSSDKTIRLWRASDGTSLHIIEGHTGGIRELAFAPDGNTLASGAGSKVYLWKTTEGILVRTFDLGWNTSVNCVAFAPNGNTLAIGTSDQTVGLWRVSDGNLLRTLEGHTLSVDSVTFRLDGSTVATGSWDGTARLWRVSDGTLLRTLEHSREAMNVAFTPDGAVLASGFAGGNVALWQVSDGSLIRTLEGHTLAATGVAFSPDGNTLISGSLDETLRLWRVSDGKLLYVREVYTGRIWNVAFAPDGDIFALALETDEAVQLWRASDGTRIRILNAHTGAFSLAFTPDAKVLASAEGEVARLWRVSDGTLLHEFKEPRWGMISVALAPDGSILAAGMIDGTVLLWRTSDGVLLHRLAGYGPAWGVAFTPDGSILASGADRALRLWQVSDGTLLHTLRGHNGTVSDLAFSPNGSLLASAAGDGTVRLWGVPPTTSITAATERSPTTVPAAPTQTPAPTAAPVGPCVGDILPHPPARYGHALAYDSARSVVVLFGGQAGSNSLDDTWEWDGTNWVQCALTTRPPARFRHALAYDSARGVTVLFGGYGSSNSLNDTWEWDGVNWIQSRPTGQPSARTEHGMAYDSARGFVVLFGGSGSSGDLNDTWEWDGAVWLQRNPVTRPSVLSYYAMVYDRARSVTVLVSGESSGYVGHPETGAWHEGANEIWEWDGVNWTERKPASDPWPMGAGRLGYALAYDSTRSVIVFFGGMWSRDNIMDDTWEWDGANWTEHSPAGWWEGGVGEKWVSNPLPRPPAQSGHAMTYDSARGVIVLFGDGTWEWDGATWVQR